MQSTKNVINISNGLNVYENEISSLDIKPSKAFPNYIEESSSARRKKSLGRIGRKTDEERRADNRMRMRRLRAQKAQERLAAASLLERVRIDNNHRNCSTSENSSQNLSETSSDVDELDETSSKAREKASGYSRSNENCCYVEESTSSTKHSNYTLQNGLLLGMGRLNPESSAEHQFDCFDDLPLIQNRLNLIQSIRRTKYPNNFEFNQDSSFLSNGMNIN